MLFCTHNYRVRGTRPVACRCGPSKCDTSYTSPRTRTATVERERVVQLGNHQHHRATSYIARDRDREWTQDAHAVPWRESREFREQGRLSNASSQHTHSQALKLKRCKRHERTTASTRERDHTVTAHGTGLSLSICRLTEGAKGGGVRDPTAGRPHIVAVSLCWCTQR